jgi:small subunit ribosomal protein S5
MSEKEIKEQERKEEEAQMQNGSEESAVNEEKREEKEKEPTVSSRPNRAKRSGFRKKKAFSKRRREERKQEFEQKIISLRRVTRVVAGGRRFSFSVAMVIGDKKGRVGVGVGKSNDTALAIEKAIRDAKANMISITRNEEGSIPFDVKAKFGSSEVEVRPAPGRGLVAGASVRAVLDLGGVTDVTSKIWTRSKNQINIARATVEALKKLSQ